MDQGETYNEDTTDSAEVSLEDESSEEVESSSDTLFGFPKKTIFIAAGILLILIILVVFVFKAKNSESQSDATADIADGANADMAQEIEVYDNAGNKIGIVYDYNEGSPILDEQYNSIGVISSTGANKLYDNTGAEVGAYDVSSMDNNSSTTTTTETDMDMSDGSDQNDDSANQFNGQASTEGWNMSGEEKASDTALKQDDVTLQLRALGYTGDEIEMAKEMGVSVPALIKQAKSVRDEEAVKAIKRMSKTGSKEFRRFLTYSVFSLPKIHYEDYNPEDSNARNYDSSFTVIADYWKVPTYGNQLQVKLKIANNTYTFMTVKPDRWIQLPNSGNMVVTVYYTVWGSKKPTMYITNVVETDQSSTTVNNDDSATSLSKLLENSVPANNDSADIDDSDDTVINDVNTTQEFLTID